MHDLNDSLLSPLLAQSRHALVHCKCPLMTESGRWLPKQKCKKRMTIAPWSNLTGSQLFYNWSVKPFGGQQPLSGANYGQTFRTTR